VYIFATAYSSLYGSLSTLPMGTSAPATSTADDSARLGYNALLLLLAVCEHAMHPY
jgi:hypothetical protein